MNADYVSYGTPRQGKQGERIDLQSFYEHVKAGKTNTELAEIDFSIFSRCLKAIQLIRMSLVQTRDVSRQIVLLYGVTGKGKTRAVYDQYPNLWEAPISFNGDTWLDGYDGQKEALFDEFEGEIPLSATKKLFSDYYVRKGPVKGGFVWFNPDIIIVTSNIHPGEWYKGFSKSTKVYHQDRSESERALRRRFNAIVHFTNDGLASYIGEDQIKSLWPVGDEIVIPYIPIYQQSIFDPNPTRAELNEFEMNQAIAEDPFDMNADIDISLL